MIDLLKYHIAHSEILLRVCADQLLHNLSLIKLCSACAIKNTSDACSLLAKETLSDLVGESSSSLIINFEQVIKSFLVWHTYFTFLVDCTFLLE